MKKVIFIDIDGVMNDEEEILATIHKDPNNYKEDDPSPKHLACLKKIVDTTGADIVLSSAWRLGLGPTQRVMDALATVNLYLVGLTPEDAPLSVIEKLGLKYNDKRCLDKTSWRAQEYGEPVISERGAEIAFWLFKHPQYKNFVILDDEDFDIKNYYPNNYIKTNPRKGLTDTEAEEAIKILNREEK